MTPTALTSLIVVSLIVTFSILSILYIFVYSRQDSLSKLGSITGFAAVLLLASSAAGALTRSGDDPQIITLFTGLLAGVLFATVFGAFWHFETTVRKHTNDQSF